MNNLLKYICLLQNNSTDNGDCLNKNLYNTRVVQLYKRNGDIYSFNDTSYFRVMSVDNGCCCLLLLNLDNGIYSSTGLYVTLSTGCIGAIRCLEDIILNF